MAERARSWGDPATALIVALTSIPLAWVLGLEQVVPPALLLGWGITVVTRHGAVLPIEVKVLLVFMLAALASSTALSGRTDWISWLRGLFTILAGIAALGLATRVSISGPSATRLVRSAVVSMLGIGLLAAAVSVDVAPLSFGVPLPQLFPNWARTRFVENLLLTRHLAIEQGFLGGARSSLLLGRPRFSGVFLYAGGLGTVVLVLQTAILLGWARLSPRWRAVSAVALVAGVFVLLLTGTRAALLLALAALAIVIATRLAEYVRHQSRTGLLAAAGAVVVVVAVLPLPGGALWHRIIVDYRPGSWKSRLEVYERTLDGVVERPLFGWGIQERPPSSIERTVEEGRLRAGTHSEPLNVLYRFGLVGATLYFAAFAALGVALARRLRGAWRSGNDERYGLVVVTVGCGAVAASSLFQPLQFDANVYWIAMALAGIARALVSMPANRPTLEASVNEGEHRVAHW